jgi:hypothetical protein
VFRNGYRFLLGLTLSWHYALSSFSIFLICPGVTVLGLGPGRFLAILPPQPVPILLDLFGMVEAVPQPAFHADNGGSLAGDVFAPVARYLIAIDTWFDGLLSNPFTSAVIS